MSKKIIIFLLIIFIPFVLSAETVLLYTMSDADVVDEKQYGDFIESAVMNEFFNAGHIIFNAFVLGQSPEHGLEHFKEAASMQMAKAGGAAFLLEVSLVYSDMNGRNLPGYAEFRLIEVVSGIMVREGTVNIDNEWIDEGDLEDGLTAMGSSMAGYALTFL